MNKKLEKLEGAYWKIAKIVSVLFVIINYQLWTEPYSFIKVVLMLVGVAVGTFIAVNVLDLIVGMIAGILKEIRRKAKDKRILKGLSKDNADE